MNKIPVGLSTLKTGAITSAPAAPKKTNPPSAFGGVGSSSSNPAPNNPSAQITQTPTTTTDMNAVIRQMESNSTAWHTADDAARKNLSEENQRLGALIGAQNEGGSWYMPTQFGLDPLYGKARDNAMSPLDGGGQGGYGQGYGAYGGGQGYGDSGILKYLEQANQSALSAVDFQTRHYLNQLEDQKRRMGEGADKAAQQAYINYKLGGRDIGSALASQGITGGAVESTLLGQLSNYENSRNAIEAGRMGGLNEIQLAVLQAEAQGGWQKANLQAQLGREYAGALMQLEQMGYQRQQDASRDQFQREQFEWGKQQSELDRRTQGDLNEWNRWLKETELSDRQTQQAYDNAVQRYMLNQPLSEADARILGFPVGSVYKPTSGSSAKPKDELTLDLAWELYRDGIRTPEVVNKIGSVLGDTFQNYLRIDNR